MQSSSITKKHVITIFAAIVILGILTPIAFNFSNYATENVRPIAQSLMQSLISQDFKKANKNNHTGKDFAILFTGEGKIETFEESGYGANSKTDIWIHYYVTGLPSETRNIALNYKKKNQHWQLVDLQITYHINRSDKHNALMFINEITRKTPSEAYGRIKDMKLEKIDAIKSIIQQYNALEKWEIIKALNQPYLGKHKNIYPNKTKLYIQSPDKKYTLFFLCKNLNNQHWIDNITIIE